jgi:hypothetical protein
MLYRKLLRKLQTIIIFDKLPDAEYSNRVLH